MQRPCPWGVLIRLCTLSSVSDSQHTQHTLLRLAHALQQHRASSPDRLTEWSGAAMDEPSAILFARELAKRSRREYAQQQQQPNGAAAASAAAASPPRAARSVPLVPVLRSIMHGVEQPTTLQPARTSFSPSPPPPPVAAAAAPAPAADASAMTDIPGDSATAAAASASAAAAPAAPPSVDESRRCLVQLPAQPDACTQECTRKVSVDARYVLPLTAMQLACSHSRSWVALGAHLLRLDLLTVPRLCCAAAAPPFRVLHPPRLSTSIGVGTRPRMNTSSGCSRPMQECGWGGR